MGEVGRRVKLEHGIIGGVGYIVQRKKAREVSTLPRDPKGVGHIYGNYPARLRPISLPCSGPSPGCVLRTLGPLTHLYHCASHPNRLRTKHHDRCTFKRLALSLQLFLYSDVECHVCVGLGRMCAAPSPSSLYGLQNLSIEASSAESEF